MIYQNLKKNLFAEIDYPQELTELIATAEPWKKFCDLSLMSKELLGIEDQKDTDAGYRFRSKKEGRENKEYFHFYEGISENFLQKEIASLIKNEKNVSEFLMYAKKSMKNHTNLH